MARRRVLNRKHGPARITVKTKEIIAMAKGVSVQNPHGINSMLRKIQQMVKTKCICKNLLARQNKRTI